MRLNTIALSSLLKKTSQWVLPHACILCQTVCQDSDICTACAKELPYCKTSCARCGLRLAEAAEPGQCCGQCLMHPPPFHHTIALFEYQNPVDQLITRLKFHEKLVYAHVLGQMMADFLAEYYRNLTGKPFSFDARTASTPNSIIPVALHKTRLRERGFNQAIELGRPIAKKLGIPLVHNACERTRATQAQSSSSLTERRQNLKGAFSLTGKGVGKHIAILDDVMTTASTMTELSQLFSRAGVEEITVWSIARSNRN